MPMIYPDRSPAAQRQTRHHSVAEAVRGDKYSGNQPVKVKLDCGCANATPKYAIIPPEVFQDALINDTPQRRAFADERIRGQVGRDGTTTARQKSEPPSEFKVDDMFVAAQQAVRQNIIPFLPAWGNIQQDGVDQRKAKDDYREWIEDHGFQPAD